MDYRNVELYDMEQMLWYDYLTGGEIFKGDTGAATKEKNYETRTENKEELPF